MDQTISAMLSFTVISSNQIKLLSVLGCQEWPLPRRQFPQSTGLLLPASSHGSCQESWLVGCCCYGNRTQSVVCGLLWLLWCWMWVHSSSFQSARSLQAGSTGKSNVWRCEMLKACTLTVGQRWRVGVRNRVCIFLTEVYFTNPMHEHSIAKDVFFCLAICIVNKMVLWSLGLWAIFVDTDYLHSFLTRLSVLNFSLPSPLGLGLSLYSQWHVHDGGHTPSSGGPGGCPVALPHSAAWFIHMHVAVHNARHHQPVSHVHHLPSTWDKRMLSYCTETLNKNVPPQTYNGQVLCSYCLTDFPCQIYVNSCLDTWPVLTMLVYWLNSSRLVLNHLMTTITKCLLHPLGGISGAHTLEVSAIHLTSAEAFGPTSRPGRMFWIFPSLMRMTAGTISFPHRTLWLLTALTVAPGSICPPFLSMH